MNTTHIQFVLQLLENGLTAAEMKKGFGIPLYITYRYIKKRKRYMKMIREGDAA
jgi:hypothetical protein